MASRNKALLIAAVIVVGAGALLPATTSAVNYVFQWAPGVDHDLLVKGRTFKVGDTLEFVYSTDPPGHNVVWVDEASYHACTLLSNNPTVLSTGNGTDSVTLTGAGLLLLISTIADDCKSGMKLAINVQ